MTNHGKPVDPYSTPKRLATYLAPRHSDIGFIEAYVRSYFGRSPSRDWIRRTREEALRHLEWSAQTRQRAGMR